MKCPKCKWQGSEVCETRYRTDGISIRRRRICLECKHKYTTREYTIKDLAETLKLKENILSNQLVDKVSFALEDVNTLASNLQDLKRLLESQVEKAAFVDQCEKAVAERHRVL